MLKKTWWEKRRKENAVDKTHYKNWCVLEIVELETTQDPSSWTQTLTSKTIYKPCAKLNVPMIYDAEGNRRAKPVSDNLTKHEAHAVAKLLNTTQGELL